MISQRLRDAIDTWPGLNVELRVLPWQWRVRFWNDWDCTASWRMELGPIKVEFWADRPMFVLDA